MVARFAKVIGYQTNLMYVTSLIKMFKYLKKKKLLNLFSRKHLMLNFLFNWSKKQLLIHKFVSYSRIKISICPLIILPFAVLCNTNQLNKVKPFYKKYFFIPNIFFKFIFSLYYILNGLLEQYFLRCVVIIFLFFSLLFFLIYMRVF